MGDIGEKRNAVIVFPSGQHCSEIGAFSQSLERDWIGLSPSIELGVTSSTNQEDPTDKGQTKDWLGFAEVSFCPPKPDSKLDLNRWPSREESIPGGRGTSLRKGHAGRHSN